MNTRLITRIIIVCTAAALLLNGCTSKPITFNTQKGTGNYSTSSVTISAKSCGLQIFFLIPIGINSRHQRAYDRLIRNSFGGYIESIEVRESWKYRYIGTSYCTEFEATMYPKI